MASIFDNYWNQVKDILGEKPEQQVASKSTAIRFSAEQRPSVFGSDAVQRLYGALEGDGWKEQKQAGSNWVWREGIPQLRNRPREVALERLIAFIGNKHQKIWTWQMSTSSGIQMDDKTKNNSTNKRRAIDLVRNNGNGSYTFVELKVGSDNPLYALFELIGYALACLIARTKGWKGSNPANDVLRASEIRLVVLGPDSWYRYKTKGRHGGFKEYDIQWILPPLIEGLNLLAGDKPRMSISFQRYMSPTEMAADEIIANAPHW